MNISICSFPVQAPAPCALGAPPQRHPLADVQLRTHGMVEYTVQSVVRRSMGGATRGDFPEIGEREMVLLSIYVPRCSLNPNQVRIVKV